MGFDPCEQGSHYPGRLDPSRFDAQAEQRHASQTGRLPAEVAAEIARLDEADLLILQYPMWWHLPPAMLKGWIDRVLAYGEVYTSQKRFEHGRFAGKQAMLSVTVGTSEATYAHDGRSGDVDLLLWPVHFTLAYVGFTVLAPFVAYGVEAGLRYSDPRGRGSTPGTGRGELGRHAGEARGRAGHPLQHHGALGQGRPHHPGRPGLLALHPPQAAPVAGVTEDDPGVVFPVPPMQGA